MAEKFRLDIFLTAEGFFDSREKAKAIIMSGKVYVNGQKELKAGTQVTKDDNIEVRADSCPYVGRGGFKLEKAFESFKLNFEEKICMDIGASTGGFTDFMLQKGALKVYAVDVGYGQLSWSLRSDSRVVNLEKTNFRYLNPENISDKIDFAAIDVSFISLRLILPVLKNFLSENAEVVCLIKPQFEAGREKVGKNGVIRNKEVHIEVIESIVSFCEKAEFSVEGLDFSPIKGSKGNIEYLLFLSIRKSEKSKFDILIDDIVDKSHNILD